MKISWTRKTAAAVVLAGLSAKPSFWRPVRATERPVSQLAAYAPQEVPSLSILDIHDLIRAAAEKHQVPEALVRSIVAAESNFDTAAVSRAGAIGLMQLMPATADIYQADPKIPEQNIDAGTRYLRCLMEKYRKSRNQLAHVIAAYNAGPGAVDRYRGVPPFRETRRYVERVLGFLKQFQRERR